MKLDGFIQSSGLPRTILALTAGPEIRNSYHFREKLCYLFFFVSISLAFKLFLRSLQDPNTAHSVIVCISTSSRSIIAHANAVPPYSHIADKRLFCLRSVVVF